MAIKSCVSELARNIAQDCNAPIVSGFTGRGVLIPADKVVVVYNQDNPHKVESLSLRTSEDRLCVIEDIFESPFDGSSVASQSENGLVTIKKNVVLQIPLRGADVSKDIIEPLLRSRSGFIAILERNDKVGDGTFPIIGLQRALKCLPDGLTQDENSKGGAYIVTLSCSEPWAELTLCPTPNEAQSPYEACREAFETLLTKAL